MKSSKKQFSFGIKTALSLVVLTSICLVLITGCSPTYVAQAAYEQAKILLAREDIEKVLEKEDLDPSKREKLNLVLKSRDFAKQIGLTPDDSYTTYVELSRDVVSWVVAASPKDSLSLYTWWFPIVGSVPYKGFFEKQEAVDEAKRLEELGYETWVRGVEAYSTLGWFNDPILSTMLNHEPNEVVHTILHESVHATIWIGDNVPFNESLAQFFAHEATKRFFEQALSNCASGDRVCLEHYQKLLEASVADQILDIELSLTIDSLIESLRDLYQKDIPQEQKLKEREEIFSNRTALLRQRYPKLTILRQINNAEILQLSLYLTNLEVFSNLFRQCNQELATFFGEMKKIKDELDNNHDDPSTPFDLLSKMVHPAA